MKQRVRVEERREGIGRQGEGKEKMERRTGMRATIIRILYIQWALHSLSPHILIVILGIGTIIIIIILFF